MSITDNIEQTDKWFVGEDKALRFTVYVAGTTQAQIDAGTATKENITGWALQWDLKGSERDSVAVITKTVAGGGIAITDGPNGVATVTITDDDTTALSPGLYRHALKRTDAGLEAILSEGDAWLQLATIR